MTSRGLAAAWCAALVVGCGPAPQPRDGGAADGGPGDAGFAADAGAPDAGARGLAVLHVADPAAAARGRAFLLGGHVGGGLVPTLAMRNLWLVWGVPAPATDAAYWAQFRARYGLLEGAGALPLGLHEVDGQQVAFDCLACHASVLGGAQVLGAPNVTFDLQGLFDDLVALSRVAPMYGFPATPPPWTISGRTQAAGANDAMGLGLALAQRYAPGTTIETRQGFQRPAAWWTLKHKQWHYVDGSGPAGAYRTMMATLLAANFTLAQLQAQDADFADLAQFLLSLDAPAWPFGAVDPVLAEQGRVVFGAHCASCHGRYEGGQFPDQVAPVAQLGTDPVRAMAMGPTEVGFVNASWFGADGAMRSTHGYLAPDLTGVWATAPYLHNGSVPTLEALLDSSKRPARFQRTGEYDPVAVGWRFTAVTAPAGQASLEARRVYDTTATGLANTGHLSGDALSADERRAVLEYLKTL